jgi:hypothetical protein
MSSSSYVNQNAHITEVTIQIYKYWTPIYWWIFMFIVFRLCCWAFGTNGRNLYKSRGQVNTNAQCTMQTYRSDLCLLICICVFVVVCCLC